MKLRLSKTIRKQLLNLISAATRHAEREDYECKILLTSVSRKIFAAVPIYDNHDGVVGYAKVEIGDGRLSTAEVDSDSLAAAAETGVLDFATLQTQDPERLDRYVAQLWDEDRHCRVVRLNARNRPDCLMALASLKGYTVSKPPAEKPQTSLSLTSDELDRLFGMSFGISTEKHLPQFLFAKIRIGDGRKRIVAGNGSRFLLRDWPTSEAGSGCHLIHRDHIAMIKLLFKGEDILTQTDGCYDYDVMVHSSGRTRLTLLHDVSVEWPEENKIAGRTHTYAATVDRGSLLSALKPFEHITRKQRRQHWSVSITVEIRGNDLILATDGLESTVRILDAVGVPHPAKFRIGFEYLKDVAQWLDGEVLQLHLVDNNAAVFTTQHCRLAKMNTPTASGPEFQMCLVSIKSPHSGDPTSLPPAMATSAEGPTEAPAA